MHASRHGFRRPGRWLPAAAAVAALALVVPACGSEGGSDTSAGGTTASGESSGSEASQGLAAAKAVVAQYSKRPTDLTISKPIAKPVPGGKHIAWILCGVPACQQEAGYFKEAATVLGWTVETIPTAGTPESVQAAWKQVARTRPDGVAATGFDRDIFENQLQQLKAADIPVVDCCVTDEATDGIIANYDDPDYERLIGKVQAAAVTVAAEGRPNVLYVDVPAFEILHPTKASYEAHFKQYAPDSVMDVMTVAITDIGKDVPGKIVNYLRAHPDVNTVSLSQGVLGVGLPAALKTAGLADRVKVFTATPGVENMQYIATGDQYASTTFALQEVAWFMADAFARHFAGEDPVKANLPIMLVTKDNLVSSSELFPAVADYQAQFKQLWGKG